MNPRWAGRLKNLANGRSQTGIDCLSLGPEGRRQGAEPRKAIGSKGLEGTSRQSDILAKNRHDLRRKKSFRPDKTGPLFPDGPEVRMMASGRRP